jgi:hypothetical protein
VGVNDDVGLESEADVMGGRAVQMRTEGGKKQDLTPNSLNSQQAQGRAKPTMQMLAGAAINAGDVLEREAVDMRDKAASLGPAVHQLQERLEQKIQRILGKRRIEVSDSDASAYASALVSQPENTPIPVTGHHRALKLNSVGVVSSVAWRPPSDASRMRVSPMSGPMNEDENSMLTEGPRPLTGAVVSQDATITAAVLADIPERASLASVMGGSASQLSGISNSEWLHMVAHSLGGADAPANVQAGPHSLNTAMIPFERLVRSSARAGKVVDYQVTFFSDTQGHIAYVHHVEIGIKLPNGCSGTWTLEVNRERQGEFINGQVLAKIEEVVNRFDGT